ncbi:MAG: alpha/beta hydrolase fold protein [Bacteriovoracaceae bacterium]|nr:alpha/beta hydrolase fold protein [Bacteriovoracaceae bacterium]
MKFVEEIRAGFKFFKTGRGKPLIIIHGGPGLNHKYLASHLSSLIPMRELIFIDQLGCDETLNSDGIIDAEKTYKHLKSAIEVAVGSKSYGIFAHSWGTYLALKLCNESASKPDELILCSPFPLNWEGLMSVWSVMNERRENKLSADVLKKLESIDPQGSLNSAVKYLDLIRPLYVHDPKFADQFEFFFYRMDIQMSVISSLIEFSQTALLEQLPTETLTIWGEEDFVPRSAIQPLLEKSKETFVLKKVGHSPFVEAADLFSARIEMFFNS